VLPKGFPKVRSYGFLSPSRRKVLPQIRTLLATCPHHDLAAESPPTGHVTFRFKKRSSAGWKRLTLPAETFIHRFLQHVLPRRFSKVRSYGLLSPSRRKGLPQLRTLLAASPSNDLVTQNTPPPDRPPPHPVPEPQRRCRTCGGLLVFLVRLSPHPREPP